MVLGQQYLLRSENFQIWFKSSNLFRRVFDCWQLVCWLMLYTTTESTSSKAFYQRIRARHETLNKRISQYKVMSFSFQHSLPYHGACFHAVANSLFFYLRRNPCFKSDINWKFWSFPHLLIVYMNSFFHKYRQKSIKNGGSRHVYPHNKVFRSSTRYKSFPVRSMHAYYYTRNYCSSKLQLVCT